MERISARAEFQPGLRFPVRFAKPGWDFQPGLKSELERAQWLCFQRNKMAVSHFSPQFQISARAETSHVIATKFQPGGRAEISARAETRHVIGPLIHPGVKMGTRDYNSGGWSCSGLHFGSRADGSKAEFTFVRSYDQLYQVFDFLCDLRVERRTLDGKRERGRKHVGHCWFGWWSYWGVCI